MRNKVENKHPHTDKPQTSHSSSTNPYTICPLRDSVYPWILSANHKHPGRTIYIIAWTQLHTINSSCPAAGSRRQMTEKQQKSNRASNTKRNIKQQEEQTNTASYDANQLGKLHLEKHKQQNQRFRKQKKKNESVPTYLMLCLTAGENIHRSLKRRNTWPALKPLCNRKWASTEVLQVSQFEKLQILVVEWISDINGRCY